MSKYSGFIGIKRPPEEVEPGMFKPVLEEKEIRGELFYKGSRWTTGEHSQSSLTVNHTVSVIASKSLLKDAGLAVYLTWQDRKWSIRSVEYSPPRVQFVLGGLYNE